VYQPSTFRFSTARIVPIPDTVTAVDAPSATAGSPGISAALFVEITRLMIVAFTTAAGYHLAGGADAERGGTAVVGAILGASTGYVLGGMLGRSLRRATGALEERIDRTPAPVLFAGAIGSTLLGGLAAALSLAAVLALPGAWGWPLFGVVTWLGVYAGFQAGARKGDELLQMLHRDARDQSGGTAAARSLVPVSSPGAELLLVDTSAAIDGRLLGVAEIGFLPGRPAVPRFVLDELQGLADAQDPGRRRLGRRGLEVLDALRSSDNLEILDDDVPERTEVDAKLVVLAQRTGARLLTLDTNLARVAELQGVVVLDLPRLARTLRPALVPGQVVRLPVSREGREPGQGVGFLDDGTMVVVTDGAELVGHEIDVRIATSVDTAKGRMFFASPAAS
jgi:uncharacterized protein YacL